MIEKLYTLKELQTNAFDDKEIIDVINHSLISSLVYEMFKFTNSKLSKQKIFTITKEDGWMNRKFWNWKEYDTFLIEVAKAYKNIFCYSDNNSIRYAQMFLSKYGFKIKDTAENENKHLKKIMNYSL